MTQKQRMIPLVADIRDFLDRFNLKEMGLIISQAQNQPPEGMSDNSISESDWYKLRNIFYAICSVKDNMDKPKQEHYKAELWKVALSDY